MLEYHTLISHIPSFLRGINRSDSSRTFPVAGIAARKTQITKRTEISIICFAHVFLCIDLGHESKLYRIMYRVIHTISLSVGLT